MNLPPLPRPSSDLTAEVVLKELVDFANVLADFQPPQAVNWKLYSGLVPDQPASIHQNRYDNYEFVLSLARALKLGSMTPSEAHARFQDFRRDWRIEAFTPTAGFSNYEQNFRANYNKKSKRKE